MMRTVPTGNLGLDVLLGGGWRLVTRLPDLPDLASATVLVRGGAGAGKTLLALQVALQLARARGGDVVVGCVEILPSEYMAQMRSARSDISADRVVGLPGVAEDVAGPRVFCGLLPDLDPSAPDLVAGLESLRDVVVAARGKPVAYVVDSLIEGYGIGASAPRAGVDAVMKFAAREGVGLVLCEETMGEAPSSWSFAADTVLELGSEPRERGRWVEVKKHRFGPSVSGRHELEIREAAAPAVHPEPQAWVARDIRDLLRWTGDGVKLAFEWDRKLGLTGPPLRAPGAFATVMSDEAGLARSLAWGLVPADSAATVDLMVVLDPLILRAERGRATSARPSHCWQRVPTMHGPARALRELVEGFGLVLAAERDGDRSLVRRVLLGDIGVALRTSHARDWAEAIRVFASLVADSSCGVQFVAFGEEKFASESLLAVHSLLVAADVNVNVSHASNSRGHQARVNVRGGRAPVMYNHGGNLEENGDLEPLDRLFESRGGTA